MGTAEPQATKMPDQQLDLAVPKAIPLRAVGPKMFFSYACQSKSGLSFATVRRLREAHLFTLCYSYSLRWLLP